jgi:hypothetical protein
MSRSRSRAPRLAGIALASALTFPALAACGATEETVTEDVYCATEDGTIVDEDYCDTDGDGSYNGSSVFIWHGSYGSGLQPGHRLSGGSHFPYNDSSRRSSIGLPRTGKVGSGGLGTTVTRTVTKGGGFGGGLSSGG